VRLEAADGMRFLAPVRATFDGLAAEVTATGADGLAIVAVTPAHAAGVVDVRVVVAAGTPYERRFTLPGAFTYVPSAHVTGIEPTLARTDGGTVVRIVGGGYQHDMVARVDGEPAELQRVSSTELLVTIPAHAPGAAQLALVNMPGSPIEDALPPEPLTYLPPEYEYHLVVATRLVDVASGIILDSQLLHGMRPVGSPVDVAEAAVVASLVGDLVPTLPLHLVDRGRDTLWVASALSVDPSAAPSVLFDALIATLDGRGFSTELRRPTTDTGQAVHPRAFYTSPVLPGPRGAPSTAVDAKALIVRPIVAQVIDRRHRRIHPNEPPTRAEEWVDTLPRRFEELRALAALAPVAAQASTAMVVRSPADDRAAEPSAWDYVTEDAIIAGLGTRIRVVDKGHGPLTRPRWTMSDVLGLPDGVAYTSWAEFRRANRQVESLLLYRPDPKGFYARLVDTATGVVLWSARTLPAREIFSGAAADTPYDRAESLLEMQPWYTWIPGGARVALVLRPPKDVDAVDWLSAGSLAQDGLISALTRSGVAVAEPMTALYRPSPPTPDRARHTAGTHVSDPWQELRLAGVTHILDATLHAGTGGTPMQWHFSLLDASDGATVGSFAAVENAEEAARAQR
jgi:hypothetical protein